METDRTQSILDQLNLLRLKYEIHVLDTGLLWPFAIAGMILVVLAVLMLVKSRQVSLGSMESLAPLRGRWLWLLVAFAVLLSGSVLLIPVISLVALFVRQCLP